MACNENLLDKLSNNNIENLSTNHQSSQMIEGSARKTSTSVIARCFPFGFRDEALALVKITFPFALGNILASWLIAFVSLALIGHARGQIELNACALGLSTYILIANSLMLGLNFGCDTLLPQCFGGNKRKMGLVVQRATILTGYCCLISWTLLLNAKYALKLIERDLEVVRLADRFLRSLILAVPFDGLSILLQKYIASNERTGFIFIINLIGNVANALLSYLLLFKFHMDLRAVAISITTAYVVIVLCALLCIRFSSIYTDTWYPIDRSCLDEWNIYLKLSIPGILMVMTEFWSIELSIFFAAYLGVRSLSAQVCAYQTMWLFYFVTASFATAVNIRIGQLLGCGKPMEAANAKNVAHTIGAIVIFINMGLIIIFHYWFPYAYDTDKNALTLARRVLLLTALGQIWDGYNIINTGIVKACGKQKYGAMISLFGFYVFGIPVAAILMFFVRIDIYGFWIGVIVAETVTNALLFTLIHRFDWRRHARTAQMNIDFNVDRPQITVATISNVHSEHEECHMNTKTEINTSKSTESIRMKICTLFVCVVFLIVGITTSVLIPI